MMTNTIVRFALIAAFVLALLYTLLSWGEWAADDTKIFNQFMFIILTGILGAIIIALYVVPMIGDAMAESLYSGNQDHTPDPSAKAAAKVSAGDYEGAVEEYLKLATEQDPDEDRQSFPFAEAAKISAERLGNYGRAREILESAIELEAWPEEEACFLRFRLFDLLHDQIGDLAAAKAVLFDLVARFPGTRHAANANHKIREIEEAEFNASQGDAAH
jgi:tetratricopeptide (TPR) repeat protein